MQDYTHGAPVEDSRKAASGATHTYSPCAPRACATHASFCAFVQVHQQELGAQVRLPPLNPKATAPLKHLAAGLGSLFAGPVDDTTLLLQWSPSVSGNTLPMGSTPAVREDHDSAAAAALSAGQAAGSKARVSAVLFGPVPGWLWAGNTDGRVHCWSVKADGSAAWLVHSWEAHSGKIKALALSPCGRLFTGMGACCDPVSTA